MFSHDDTCLMQYFVETTQAKANASYITCGLATPVTWGQRGCSNFHPSFYVPTPNVEAGDWRVEAGDWRVEAGDWRVEAGDWRVEAGDWRVETVESA
ncbi:hypothetical protein SARC_09501 [Sphaeroforma arctica JP610]|uniref:Uncharacterized protein n=1 Tax=Sphaeroforma arctica JP610 TaxID=667725 RepID=A0A0L0FMR9_9EUKA|nr:hypothetical protein SARC_09501 [Sphaeroforma arctica JP610]KNC78055.1 hypothetical protein SARC_09501 [Sphaeroforma arctica JP610]|eukprot:XP_014151957.1 hypothetical protein SARC_09501 [Sphaeroforma arctica JP610]